MGFEALSGPPSGIVWKRLHPATFLLDVLRLGRAVALPLLVVTLLNRSGSTGTLFWIFLAGSGLSVLGSLSRLISTRYALDGSRLFVHSGLLFRTQRIIPADRVQNLHQESGVLHRMFQVVEVRIETAGAAGAEATLAVIARGEAETLRAALLAARREEAVAPPAPYLLRRASVGEVLLAGATETRVGLLLASLWGLYEVLREAGTEEREIYGFLERTFSATEVPAWAMAVAGVLAALLFGWIASIAMTLLSDHGFELSRLGSDLKKSHGLLNRVEVTIPIPRIQALGFDANGPRILLGWVRARVATAGSARDAEKGGTTTIVPLVPRTEAAGFGAFVYPGLDLSRVILQAVHPLARRRGFSRALLVLGIPLVLAAGFRAEPDWLFGLIPAAGLAWVWSTIRYRILGYARVGEHLVVRHGVLHHHLQIVPKEKLQTVALSRSPIQRWLGLATLHASTAGTGGLTRMTIPDLGETDADELFDALSLEASRGGSL